MQFSMEQFKEDPSEAAARATRLADIFEAKNWPELARIYRREAPKRILEARLAELDLSNAARVMRAEAYGFRADEINPKLKYGDGGTAFAHLYHSVERRAELEALAKKAQEKGRNNRPGNVDGFGQLKRMGSDIISRGYFN